MISPDLLVAVRGGGDLGSAAVLRLHRIGIRVVILERPDPLAVRRTVSFSEAVSAGTSQVEDVKAVLAHGPEEAYAVWDSTAVPLLIDPNFESLQSLPISILVNATMAKRSLGMRRDQTPGSIALGPGHVAGVDVDAVVETNRGPNLGRVIWSGPAETDTHVPAAVSGYAAERVMRAPRSGRLETRTKIGAIVARGTTVGAVNGVEIRASFEGLVRGLLRDGTYVTEGQKVGDIDPRLDPELCHKVSDKALAVAGGVVEASLILVRRIRERASG